MEEKHYSIITRSCVRFSPENEFTYGQDFRFYKGIPSDVDFYPVDIMDSYVKFIGDGYGILKEHKMHGSYGNGAIYVIKSELPDMLISFCKAEIEKQDFVKKRFQKT